MNNLRRYWIHNSISAVMAIIGLLLMYSAIVRSIYYSVDVGGNGALAFFTDFRFYMSLFVLIDFFLYINYFSKLGLDKEAFIILAPTIFFLFNISGSVYDNWARIILDIASVASLVLIFAGSLVRIKNAFDKNANSLIGIGIIIQAAVLITVGIYILFFISSSPLFDTYVAIYSLSLFGMAFISVYYALHFIELVKHPF